MSIVRSENESLKRIVYTMHIYERWMSLASHNRRAGEELTDNPIDDLDDPKRSFPLIPPFQRLVHQEPQTSSKNEP